MPIEMLYTDSEISVLTFTIIQKEVLTAKDLKTLQEIQIYRNKK